MPVTKTAVPQAVSTVEQDDVLRIFSQTPESTNGTRGGISGNGDFAVGVPFVVKARCQSAAALKTPTTYSAAVFDDNAPFKCEILRVVARLVSYTSTDWTDADGGNLDITVLSGVSGTPTDVVADVALDDTFTAGDYVIDFPLVGTTQITNAVIDVDDQLVCQLIADPDDTIVAGAGAGPATVDFYITLMRLE